MRLPGLSLGDLRNQSITRKLSVVILATTAFALVVSAAALLLYERKWIRTEMIDEVGTLAQVVGDNSAAALMFRDSEAATDILSALQAHPNVRSAALFEPEGALLATYSRPGSEPPERLPERPPDGSSTWFTDEDLLAVRDVHFQGDRVGSLLVVSDTERLASRTRGLVLIVALVVLGALTLAFLMSRRLQAWITDPIFDLVRTARQVSTEGDYSVRARKVSEDELGLLVTRFNEMLEKIQERDEQLRRHQDELEEILEERLQELRQRERQLRQAQKMEAVGRLAGGVAHDFNNLLTAVIGYAQLVRSEIDAYVDLTGRGEEPGEFRAVSAGEAGLAEGEAGLPEDEATLTGGEAEAEAGFTDGESLRRARAIEPGSRDPDGILDQLSTDIDEIVKASKQASSLTQQLLAFSRQQVLDPKVLSINEAIADVEKMLTRLLGDDIRLEFDLDPDTGLVEADLHQIQQVVLNLAVNSRDAMPEGGRLDIRTFNADEPQPSAEPLPDTLPEEEIASGPADRDGQGTDPGEGGDAEEADAGYVALEVRDTGIGMDEETRSHIFEPFFTTKEVDKGTGLGLATVYGIVRQSGGRIAVDSEVGEGSCFTVYLPRVREQEVADEAVAETADVPSGHGETVLVVEDQPAVRQLVDRVLHEHGYRVLEAESAEDALQICTAYSGAIDLLITDVVMPGMSGYDLAKRLVQESRTKRVLYMSGNPERAGRRPDDAPGESLLLHKPFKADDLLRRVNASLGA